MKTFLCEVAISDAFCQAEVEPVNIQHYKFAGKVEASYDLELITLSDLPASCFTEETIEEVLKQAREDNWLTAEIAEHLHVDRFAGIVDYEYDRMIDRKAGGF